MGAVGRQACSLGGGGGALAAATPPHAPQLPICPFLGLLAGLASQPKKLAPATRCPLTATGLR